MDKSYQASVLSSSLNIYMSYITSDHRMFDVLKLIQYYLQHEVDEFTPIKCATKSIYMLTLKLRIQTFIQFTNSQGGIFNVIHTPRCFICENYLHYL